MRKGWSRRPLDEAISENQLKSIFREFDVNRDGKLSRKELKVGLKSIGIRFSGFRAWRAVRHVDANGDGMIGEEEIDELIKYASKWGIIVTP
ncbi:hypothetical protein QVD17_10412 [Tagetes erecta]|uniref:EF-hand domain-containing protein n=1 Tax=Tagetes erecta TaxID=13708 RepID=A0AAD8P6A1_TARER|nr:hypothetical protein QVD17_10412 [Tagetes erecta]